MKIYFCDKKIEDKLQLLITNVFKKTDLLYTIYSFSPAIIDFFGVRFTAKSIIIIPLLISLR